MKGLFPKIPGKGLSFFKSTIRLTQYCHKMVRAVPDMPVCSNMSVAVADAFGAGLVLFGQAVTT